MNKLLALSLWALAAVSTTAMAQNMRLRNSEYLSMTRSWEGGPLVWEEFKGEPTRDTTVLELSWMFRPTLQKENFGNTTYHYFKVKPYLDLSGSWMRRELQSASSLKMCQTAFDLLELYGRKATREYAFNHETYLADVMEYYERQYNRRMKNMVYDTRQGTDEAKVDLYATQVALELEQESLDLSQTPLGQSVLYYGIDLGVHSMMAFSDHFGFEPIGIAWTLDFGYKRHLWMIDMALCFGGECKLDVETSNGWIRKGDAVHGGMMMLNWGYRMGRDEMHPWWPFVGVGVTFFDGESDGYHLDKNGRELSPEKTGFTLATGVIYDIPFRRHVYLHNNGTLLSIPQNNLNQYSLRLKPSVSLCKLSGIGWTPCINLGVCFDMSTWAFR